MRRAPPKVALSLFPLCDFSNLDLINLFNDPNQSAPKVYPWFSFARSESALQVTHRWALSM
jgi:hypothetical protein